MSGVPGVKASENRLRLTIIIPHHNRPEMLEELINSLPQRSDIEVVVVDDHSTRPLPQFDGSPFRVRLLHLGASVRYAGAARNLGIESAKGEWVFFADSDDRFHSEALEKILADLPRETADLVYARSSSFRHDGSPGDRHIAFNSLLDQAGTNPVGLVQFYPPWAKFIRRRLLDDSGLRFESVRVSNDVMFSGHLYFAAKTHRVRQEVVYAIRQGNESLTSRVDTASISERLDVLARYNDLLMDHGLSAYRVPAIGQLIQTARAAPLFTLRRALRVRFSGHPVIFTRAHLKKHLKRFRIRA